MREALPRTLWISAVLAHCVRRGDDVRRMNLINPHPTPSGFLSALHYIIIRMSRVLDITQTLIACPSVTPEDAGAQVYLAQELSALGFTCHHLPFGDVPNLFARLGGSGPHLCYAGHTDVVPPGPLAAWTTPPFEASIRDGVLYGRGASDMKGSVAAFLAAAESFIKRFGIPKNGSISMLITGDEEGPAVNGTVKVLEWMKEHNHIPDVFLVGEPTNPSHHGQEMKIGRRGSLGGVLTVTGKQGHVAYPERANNPLPRLIALLAALEAHMFDKGSEFFPATNLELTSIDVGNTADNVIPAEAKAKFNVRFNDKWSGRSLGEAIEKILNAVSTEYHLKLSYSSESFLTEPGEWPALVRQAAQDICGKAPAYTTTGGTSDARFCALYAPVVEYGGVNATIHQIDENTGIDVLNDIARIYERVLELYFEQA
jgi:succinyl-diaminopimelate desuccinylase